MKKLVCNWEFSAPKTRGSLKWLKGDFLFDFGCMNKELKVCATAASRSAGSQKTKEEQSLLMKTCQRVGLVTMVTDSRSSGTVATGSELRWRLCLRQKPQSFLNFSFYNALSMASAPVSDRWAEWKESGAFLDKESLKCYLCLFQGIFPATSKRMSHVWCVATKPLVTTTVALPVRVAR